MFFELKNNNKELKIGFAYGDILKEPGFFRSLIPVLKKHKHLVYILTGRELNEDIVKQLSILGINCNGIFSITSYHKDNGAVVEYKNNDPTQPLLAPYEWDSTKAKFAKELELDIYMDSSTEYRKYFDEKIHYIVYDEKMKVFLSELLTWLNGYEEMFSD